MIWGILFLLIVLSILLVWPVLNQPAPVTAADSVKRELEASKTQLAQIEAEIASGYQDEDSAGRAKRAMERRILKLADKLEALSSGQQGSGLSPVIRFGVPVVIALGTLSLYPLIGSPDYSREAAGPASPEIPESLQNMSLPELIAELEQRLEAMPEKDPVGYVLLARAKIRARDFEGALADYGTALELSGNDPDIAAEMAEMESAIARLEAGSGSAAPDISPEQAETFNQMTEDERMGQIRAMVDGLAARLEGEPDDLQGWLRLIRARTVLGETDQAQADLASARETFSDDPAAMAQLDQMATNLPD